MIERRRIILLGMAAVAVAITAASCANQGPGPEAILESWVGHSEKELVAHFGIPRRAYENRDGSRLVEIVRYWSGVHEYPCRVTFSISPGGIVTDYRMSGVSAGVFGNACLAPSARPAFTVDDMR